MPQSAVAERLKQLKMERESMVAQGPEPPAKPPIQRDSEDIVSKTTRAVSGAATGVAKGVSSTIQQMRNALPERAGAGLNFIYPDSMHAAPPTAPENNAEAFGYGAERAGEYMLGGSGVGARMAKYGLLPRMAAQGATASGISALHGGSPEEVAGTGLIAGATPAVHDALSYAANAIGHTIIGQALANRFGVIGKILGQYMGRGGGKAPTGVPTGEPINAKFVEPDFIDTEFTTPQRPKLGMGDEPMAPKGKSYVEPPQPSAPPKQIESGIKATRQIEAPTDPNNPAFQGQEGGLGPKPHVDVVAQRPMIVRTVKGDGSGAVPGRMRLETPNEMKARLQNFGRGVTKQPTAEAQPYKPPSPPKAPPKK